MKNLMIQTAAFLIWCFVLLIVSLAPLFLDTAEAVAAILCAAVAAFGILIIMFWESL